MNTFALLQFSENVAAKSADMAARDPHGAIITLVSVSVVFCALITLFFAYSLIGKISSGTFRLPERSKRKPKTGVPTQEEAAAIALAIDQEMNGETYAAIGLALHQYLDETVHDHESYIITIRRPKR